MEICRFYYQFFMQFSLIFIFFSLILFPNSSNSKLTINKIVLLTN